MTVSVTDIAAEKKWRKMPVETRRLLLNNVFCSKCFVTTITDYSLHDEKDGILIKGKCKHCGKDVARFVENE